MLAQAEENRFYRQAVTARRGVLLDRYGQPLVWNIQKYFQVLNPNALYVQKQPITREQALQIMATESAKLIETETERQYRYSKALAHVLGYVGEVTAEELQQRQELKPGQQVGKTGLEFVLEKELKGKNGTMTYEINALGERQRQVQTVPPQSGEDVVTTLDPYLSTVAAAALGNAKGAVVMSDARTGKVLVLTSQPSFDPNVLSHTETDLELERSRHAQVQQFFQDPQQLFFNRAVAGAYPPGSVFKLVTALGGLEHNAFDQDTQVQDEGVLKVGEYEYGNWYYRQYGRMEGAISLVRAIARSNDIFFYKAAEWLGPAQLAEVAREFGYGQKTGIELPAEARGNVPDPDWKEKVKGERWFLGNTYHFGIGQGDLLTSPVQVLQMTQAIGNEGQLCQLSLMEKKQGSCRELGIEQKYIDLVKQGMLGACSTGGTAYTFFSYNTGRVTEDINPEQSFANGAVGCKTGTAEFGAADAQGHRRTHAWFTALVPNPLAHKLDSTVPMASSSAIIRPANSSELHQEWLKTQEGHPLPDLLAITVMLESDDEHPFREGSRDAGEITRSLVDWMVQP